MLAVAFLFMHVLMINTTLYLQIQNGEETINSFLQCCGIQGSQHSLCW